MNRRLNREDIRIPAGDIGNLDTRRECALKRILVDHINNVRAPITEAAITIIIPAAPFATHEVGTIRMERRRRNPARPIEC